MNGTTKASFDGKEFDFADWQRLSMREAIMKYWPEAAAPKPEIVGFRHARVRRATLVTAAECQSHAAHALRS